MRRRSESHRRRPTSSTTPTPVPDLRSALGRALLSGNKAVEDAAVAFVIGLERDAGRVPVDRRDQATYPADIESPPRTIEIKAVGGSQRGWFLPLEVPQVNEARSNPEFFIYIVDNVRQGDPSKFGLKVGGERLGRLLTKAKERR